MSALVRAANRVKAFFRKPEHDADLDAEMAAHLDLAIDENIQQGMNPEEARRQALIRFGGVQQAREGQRAERGLPWLDVLMQDLRFTFRTLCRDRAFTAVAILILALGIGANIAVFSVVNTILLRPLPFPDPDQLVRITSRDFGGALASTFTVDATQAIQQQNKSYQSVSGYFAFTAPENFKLTGIPVPLPVTGILVADHFFETLGVQPILGRLFTPDEYLQLSRSTVLLRHPTYRTAVLLSYPFWKQHFNSDRTIIGEPINMNDSLVTVIGVLPEKFDFGSVFAPGAKVDVFTPFVAEDHRGDGNDLALIARLKPGISIAQAQAEADLLFPALYFELKHPEYGKGYTGNVYGLKDYVSGKLRRSLIVLWCAVGMILLIVCVNLSNLLMARAASRTKEFAVRSALGAGRGRLLRQLMTESLVLSSMGAVGGLTIAYATVRYLAHQGSIALPLLGSIRIDGEALVWTLLVVVVTAVLFGLAPGLRMSSRNLQESLKDSGHGTSAGRKNDRLRSAFVISEVALACVLMVGAGLLLRSFLRVLDVDLGFQPAHAAAISMDYYDDGKFEKRRAIWQEALRRVEAIPGVHVAGISDNLPLSRNREWSIAVKGRNDKLTHDAFVYVISPGYLQALGLRLVEGRDIRWDDNGKDLAVVIINQTLARVLWPNQNSIGRVVDIGGVAARVIGVVADVRESSVETLAGNQMYVLGASPQFSPDGAQLVIRSKLPPETLASSVLSTLRQINPGQPATEFKPIHLLVDHAVSPRRFFVLLVVIFAGLGLLLASLGIYGVISYSVTQRTQEIGIRMALGATRAAVQLGVIGKTLGMAAGGIALGTLASLAVSRLVASLLFGTDPNDPYIFLIIVMILGAVGLLAGYLPARRASRIDPVVALRNH